MWRLTVLAAILLLAAGTAAWHFGLRPEASEQLITSAGEAVAVASDAGIERTADFWLSETGRQHAANDPAASAPALAAAIRLGRLEAIRSGVQPISAESRRVFREHYPAAVINSARWLVASPNSRLGRVLARWPVEEGAITLGNVIVFKTRSASQSRALLAHELAHIQQYHTLGIDGFARRYAVRPEQVEAEAWQISRDVMQKL